MATSKSSQTAGESKNTEESSSNDDSPVISVNGSEPDTSAPKAPTGETTTMDGSSMDEEVPTMSELNGIRYVGMADVKTITAYDLLAMGVEDPKGDLVWSTDNGKVVRTSEFNAATRDLLLANKDFVVA